MSERNPSRRRRPQSEYAFELGRRMSQFIDHPLFDRNLMGDILDYTDPIFREIFLKIHSELNRSINPDLSVIRRRGWLNSNVATNFCSIHDVDDVYPARQLRHFFPEFPPQLQNILEDIMRHFTEDPLRFDKGRALAQISKRLSKYNNFDPQLMNVMKGYVTQGGVTQGYTLRTVWSEHAIITDMIFDEEWQTILVELYESLFEWLRTEGVQLNPRLNEYVAVIREVDELAHNTRLQWMNDEAFRTQRWRFFTLEPEWYVSPITDEEVSYMSGKGLEYLIFDIQQMLRIFFEALTTISPDDLFSD